MLHSPIKFYHRILAINLGRVYDLLMWLRTHFLWLFSERDLFFKYI